jgi:WD40 repeat protein
VSLADLGKPTEAEELWAEVLRAERDHPEAGYNLGLARWRAGRVTFDEVTADLQEVAASFPADPRPPLLAARIHLEAGDPSAAATALGPAAAGPEADLVREAIRIQTARLPRQVWAGEHPGATAVLWAGDRHLITAGHDRTLRMWEAITGRLTRTLRGHRSTLVQAVASADGRFVLSGSEPDEGDTPAELILWDLSTGERRWTQVLPPSSDRQPGGFVPLAVDGDIAVSCANGVLQVWAGRACVAEVAAAGFPVGGTTHLAVTRMLAGESMVLRVWEMPTGKLVNEFPVPENAHDLTVTAGGRFAAGRMKGALRTWDLATGAETAGPPPGAVGFAVTTGGPAEYTHHLLTVRQAATDRPVAVFAPHGGEVDATAAIGPGDRLATIGGNAVAVWQLDGAAEPWTAPPAVCVARRSEAVVAAEEAADDALAAARAAMAGQDWASAANHVRTARRQPGADRRGDALALWAELEAHLARGRFRRGWWADTLTAASVKDLAMTRDGHRLLVAEHSGFRVWDVPVAGTLGLGRDALVTQAVALTAGGATAFTATGVIGRPFRIEAWDACTGQRRWEATLPPLAVGVGQLRSSGDGRILFSVQGDQSVRRWDAGTGALLATHVGRLGGVTAVAPAEDGSWFAAVDVNGAARVLDAATGRCRRTLVRTHARAVAVAGRLVLIGRAAGGPGGTPGTLPQDEVLTLWDAGTGVRVRALIGSPLAGAECVALSADGALAVAGFGDTAAAWAVDTGDFLRAFPGHGDEVRAVAAGDDRRRVATAAGDSVRLWALDWELANHPPLAGPDPPPLAWADTFEPYTLAPRDEERAPAPATPVEEPVSLRLSKLVLTSDGLYRGRLDGPRELLHPLADITAVELRFSRRWFALVWFVGFLIAAAVGYHRLTGAWAVAAGAGGAVAGLLGLGGLYSAQLRVTTAAGTAVYTIYDLADEATAFAASVRLAAGV